MYSFPLKKLCVAGLRGGRDERTNLGFGAEILLRQMQLGFPLLARTKYENDKTKAIRENSTKERSNCVTKRDEGRTRQELQRLRLVQDGLRCLYDPQPRQNMRLEPLLSNIILDGVFG